NCISQDRRSVICGRDDNKKGIANLKSIDGSLRVDEGAGRPLIRAAKSNKQSRVSVCIHSCRQGQLRPNKIVRVIVFGWEPPCVSVGPGTCLGSMWNSVCASTSLWPSATAAVTSAASPEDTRNSITSPAV